MFIGVEVPIPDPSPPHFPLPPFRVIINPAHQTTRNTHTYAIRNRHLSRGVTATAARGTVCAADGVGADQFAVGSVQIARVFCGKREVLGGEWEGEGGEGGE